MKLIVACLLFALVLGNEIDEKDKVKRNTLWSKVGLAWSDGTSSNLWALAGNGWNVVSWAYTWGPSPTTPMNQAQLDFVPMLWGGDTERIQAFQSAQSAWPFTTAVLGFNEPDNGGQANLAFQTAANLYREHITPLDSKYSLGSPAVESNDNGKEWLVNFMNSCGDCGIDFIALHWYGSNAQTFQAYVTDMHNTFGKNVWITEWACVPDYQGTCTQQQVYDFMGATTEFLFNSPWVERYSWFGAMASVPSGIPTEDLLLTSGGQDASPLGLQFVESGGCGCY